MLLKSLLLVVAVCSSSANAALEEDDDHHRGQPNLVELARQLNLTRWADGVESTGLDKVLRMLGMFTIFAPTDEAFEHEKFYPQEDGLKDKLKFHIATDLYKSSDIANELTVKSMLSKRTIRFNVYKSGQVVTANGRPVVSVDHYARNGVIHVVSEVMSSVYKRQGSVVSEIDECCPQHSMLLELIRDAKLFDVLDTKGPFTFFAPLNGAFEKLPADFLAHLRQNVTALRAVLLSHVVPDTFYSVGLEDGATLKTVFGNKVTVGVKQDGTVTVGKATVTLADVTAGNGVIHSIDEVLLPKKIMGHSGIDSVDLFAIDSVDDVEVQGNDVKLAKEEEEKGKKADLVEVLRQKGFTSFHDALVKTKLDRVLSSHDGAFTVFAPSNAAFDVLAKELSEDMDGLAEVVKFHVARGVVKPDKVKDGDRMRSLLPKRFVTFNTYTKEDRTTLVLANGRPVAFTGHEASNGVIHEIADDRAMDFVYSRTNGTLYNEIASIPRFSKFTSFLDQSGLAHFLTDTQFTYTVLVPSNSVFDRLISTGDSGAPLDGKLLSHLFVDHVLSDVWYEAGLATRSFVRSLSGKIVPVDTDHQGKVTLDKLHLIRSDFTTLNGVFHEVDGMLD